MTPIPKTNLLFFHTDSLSTYVSSLLVDFFELCLYVGWGEGNFMKIF